MTVLSLHSVPAIVVLLCVAVASGTDIWKFRIHNVLTIPMTLSGLIFHTLVSQTFGLSVSVLGILVGTLPFIMLYAKGGMGGGDLKLMAGLGAWLGPWLILHVIIVSGLSTGAYSAGLMIWNRLQSHSGPGGSPSPGEDFGETSEDVIGVLSRRDRRSHAVPFGAMAGLGIIVTLLYMK